LPNSRWSSADERAETLAETGLRHLRHVFEAIGSARITQMAIGTCEVLRDP
jgi:hypothetical protein